MAARQRRTAADGVTRRPRRFALLAGGFVVLVVVVVAVVFGYQALQARAALKDAQSAAEQLQTQIADADAAAAAETLDELQQATDEAHAHTDGVLWDLGASIPWVGESIAAAQTVARVVDDIADNGLAPLVDIAGSIDSRVFSPVDGRIDIAAIEEIAPGINAAADALSAGLAELRSIDRSELFGPLEAPVMALQSKIADAEAAASAGATATSLMPAMLGGAGARTYLLVFQNNAEIRATGGLPGAWATVRADNGELEILKQGSASDFDYHDDPVVDLTQDELNLYSELMANFFQDSNFTPDFPRTGQIMKAFYAADIGGDIDGVISVDPIALSYILNGTGPVDLGSGLMLTSDNAVQLLLNYPYLELPTNALQDLFFAVAAKKVFDAVSAGQGDPREVIEGVLKATGENRILVWSARPEEQKVLRPTAVSGALPRDSGSTPRVGLFLNDSTTTKLEYYLNYETTVDAVACTDDDTQTIETKTVLTSDVPSDVSSFSKFLLGPGTGEEPGSMRLNLRFYAPYGGLVTDLSITGEEQTVNIGTHHDRNVAIVPVLIKPGGKVTVTTAILSGRGQAGDVVFRTTPGINPTPNDRKIDSACG